MESGKKFLLRCIAEKAGTGMFVSARGFLP